MDQHPLISVISRKNMYIIKACELVYSFPRDFKRENETLKGEMQSKGKLEILKSIKIHINYQRRTKTCFIFPPQKSSPQATTMHYIGAINISEPENQRTLE